MSPSFPCCATNHFVLIVWILFMVLCLSAFISFYVFCYVWVYRGALDLPIPEQPKCFTVLKTPGKVLREDQEIFTVEKLDVDIESD